MGFQLELDRCPARLSSEIMIQQHLERNEASWLRSAHKKIHPAYAEWIFLRQRVVVEVP
jgi:hypothetical protein